MKERWKIILTGILIGGAAVLLTALGNPGNMGFCIACFLRDIAGAMKLHSAGAVQYMRPEILGLVIGAFLMSIAKKEFRPRGGSSPFIRFILGAVVMIGALMFLGCPLRMMLRIGGGDLNAIVGLVGFVFGIWIGTLWMNKGFSLNRAYNQSKLEGAAFPVMVLAFFGLWALVPSLFAASEAGAGPGALHAAVLVSLVVGLVAGALAQRTRFCTVAASRDAILFKDMNMLWGFIAVIAAAAVGNLILAKFNLSFADQPVAHTDGLWNFLGMALVGWGSVLLGGCPLRQLILAGEGNSDSAITVAGLIFGAALCHNFSLASSGKGPTTNGMIAVVIGFVIVALISVMNSKGGSNEGN